MTDGRRRRGNEKRNVILSQAVKVASREGLEGLTLGRLASDLGIAKSNITILFGDKEALQLKTIDAAVDISITEIVAPASRKKTPLKRLQALCDRWFDYVDRRVLPGGCFLNATSNEYRARPGPIQDRIRYYRGRWEKLLGATIREAQDAGELRRDLDVDQLVFELVAFQAAANVAALLGDRQAFLRARRTTRDRIASARTEERPRRTRRRTPLASI